MKLILIILASIWTVFGATYTVTPTQKTATVTDIGFTVTDTTWQLQTVVDNYHLGGVTYGKTYWGTTRNVATGNGEIGYYYWCGGMTTWCYKTVHTYLNASSTPNIWNVNGVLYVYVPHSASTDLKVNYTDTLWYDTTYSRRISNPVASKDGLFFKIGNDSIWSYDTSGTLSYKTRGYILGKDLQNNLWNMYDKYYVYINNTFQLIDKPVVASGYLNIAFSPTDTMLFEYAASYYTNLTDTLRYTISSDRIRSSSFSVIHFADFRFIPYAKKLIQIDWLNKQVITYAFPESAMTNIYMPSSDTVYYGRSNINKIMILEKLITKLEKQININNAIAIYPNPSNPSTSISFKVSQKSLVQIAIYNLKGELIRTLANSQMPSGSYSVAFNGMVSGTYICKTQIGEYSKALKLTVIK